MPPDPRYDTSSTTSDIVYHDSERGIIYVRWPPMRTITTDDYDIRNTGDWTIQASVQTDVVWPDPLPWRLYVNLIAAFWPLLRIQIELSHRIRRLLRQPRTRGSQQRIIWARAPP